ncbi:hypothetical protein [Vibrio taketomensis]|uniref:hypothetical protein n=1 Tax=Vibrio taketomensis TaxID=2572923 RepID=UPI001389EAD2|nr:hypothetical protein [Vibrio taketomensis]
MTRILSILTMFIVLGGCVNQEPHQAESSQIKPAKVNFVIGNVTPSFDIKLSRGSLDDGVFKEDWFSTLQYRMTEDQRYIVGSAEEGAIIAVTSVKATDAGGNHLGTFTPCNQTLVFQLPRGFESVYVTDIYYDWHNVVMYPVFKNNIHVAKDYFKSNLGFGIYGLAQATHRNLDADLYRDCETQNVHPLVMTRPF